MGPAAGRRDAGGSWLCGRGEHGGGVRREESWAFGLVVVAPFIVRGAAAGVFATRSAMSSRLFVGNLPFDATEKEVRALFKSGGHRVVSLKIVSHKETGR